MAGHPSGAQLAEIAKIIDSGKLAPVIDRILPLSEVRRAHELSQSGHTHGKIVLRVSNGDGTSKGNSHDSWVQVFVNSRRIREFLPRLRPAANRAPQFFSLVNRVLRTPLAFDMLMPPSTKGDHQAHETDTWNIAGRRSWVSDDALDSGFARSTNVSRRYQRRKALSNFCEAYWPPLYAFLRHRGHASPEAQDLVQGFFAHLLEQNTLSRADQEKGRLRTFLFGSLQNFLFNEYDRAHALKRGGGHQIVSIDEHLPEAEASMMDTAHLSDSRAYDLAWASNIVKRAWQHVARCV